MAAATGTLSQANSLTTTLWARIGRVQSAVHGRARPAVFACEWLDPPFAAGHWVPEMVALVFVKQSPEPIHCDLQTLGMYILHA